MEIVAKPWHALWALVLGFFMILVDSTIVSVANPKIMEGLNTDIRNLGHQRLSSGLCRAPAGDRAAR